ncbi:MAG: hypothetical protein ACRDNN_08280, partial [Gaiellaceae bacterium]
AQRVRALQAEGVRKFGSACKSAHCARRTRIWHPTALLLDSVMSPESVKAWLAVLERDDAEQVLESTGGLEERIASMSKKTSPSGPRQEREAAP